MKRLALIAAVSAVALAGCTTTNPYTGTPQTSKTVIGAGVGAGVGAILGAATNTSNSEQARKNALIGAGIGALVGAGVGNYMDRQQAELAAELRSTGVSVTRLPGNQILLNMPSDVTFASDQDAINSSFYPVLGSVAKVLKKYNQTLVDVRGHADSDGPDDYNLALSQRRAISVANYLTGQGILPGRLIVQGFGESQPIATNATAAGKALNRRVEIQIAPYTG
jgi:outer membrane protein OmpA-like peptidoglycan-associated protein